MAKRLPFFVTRTDDEAVVAMDCGEGVIRARNMPVAFLSVLADACTQIRTDVIDVLSTDADRMAQLPSFPECEKVAGGDLGPCTVSVVASREEDGPQFTVAFYDADDDDAPTLVLVDEQIEEFIQKAKETSSAAAPRSG